MGASMLNSDFIFFAKPGTSLRKNNCKGKISIVFDKGNNSQEIFDALTSFKKPDVKSI
jgi:hypothetical protein